ncbi:MAG: hypothetical protein KAS23_14185, partial [Anaerohalosphaera sp.]|nr:hypothetical protein [Anaerohalosphaera sp.]
MIKRIVFSLLIVLSLGSGEVLARRRLANERKDGLDIYSIDRILKLNDKEIDIGTAALVLSRQWGTEKILRRYRDVIDDMAEDVLDRMNDAHVKGGLRAIRIMNKYLFEEKDFGSIKTADNPNDLFLHTVLEKKRGYCLSLSVLYLAVGERVGLDLHGVVVPGH